MCVKSILSPVSCGNYTHSSDPAVGMLEGSLALQPGDQQLADHDQQETVAGFALPVPARQRFALWSIRYVLVLAGVDAFIGGIAAAIPASLSDSLYAYQAVPLLCVIGLLFWPSAIGVSRGYRRARIGVGSDEFRRCAAGRIDHGCGLRATGWIPRHSK